jgi:hypothetical protein
MTNARQRLGRKAISYPDMDTLRMLVEYDPIDCVVRYTGPFKVKPIRDKNGHVQLKLPVNIMAVDRGTRQARYFRMDHITWALVTGEWPTGWIEHINGLRADCAIANLVHLDDDGKRWWWFSGMLMEVQGNDDGPITHVVTDDQGTRVEPWLANVLYEVENA